MQPAAVHEHKPAQIDHNARGARFLGGMKLTRDRGCGCQVELSRKRQDLHLAALAAEYEFTGWRPDRRDILRPGLLERRPRSIADREILMLELHVTPDVGCGWPATSPGSKVTHDGTYTLTR